MAGAVAEQQRACSLLHGIRCWDWNSAAAGQCCPVGVNSSECAAGSLSVCVWGGHLASGIAAVVRLGTCICHSIRTWCLTCHSIIVDLRVLVVVLVFEACVMRLLWCCVQLQASACC